MPITARSHSLKAKAATGVINNAGSRIHHTSGATYATINPIDRLAMNMHMSVTVILPCNQNSSRSDSSASSQ
jgi:hypothetical protein